MKENVFFFKFIDILERFFDRFVNSSLICFLNFTEGLTLFLAPERPPEDDQERASKRQELRNIVKKKIKKSVRNALPRHAKPNKRFKRMAKDF